MDGRFARHWILTLMVLLFCISPLTGEGAPRPDAYRVLIDPAHGGEDSGTISDKVREKELTMSIALQIRQEAQKIPGLHVQLTRTADKTMTAAERAKMASEMKADCLLSLHINAGFGKKSSGYEIYFPGFRQAASGSGDSSSIIQDMVRNKSLNDSVRLAQQIQSGLEKVFPRKGRGLREAPNPLLDRLTIPGLVIEIGFGSNPEDQKSLAENRNAVAGALLQGLQQFLSKTP